MFLILFHKRTAILIVSGFLFFCLNLFSQDYYTYYKQYDYNEKFAKRFDEAILHMGKAEMPEALAVLKELYKEDSSHCYIQYLMGVCFTEQNPPDPLSYYYLEKATENILVDYALFSYKERRAPVFTYYYLVKAYTQHGKCAQAEKAFENFHLLYGIEKYDYFVVNAESLIQACINKDFSKSEKRKNLVTKYTDFTLTAPLFGVQIGAFSELIPIHEFNNLRNVEAYIDSLGTIRYIIGHFPMKRDAQSLLNAVREKGYKDAFITNVNVPKKFEEEIIIVNNQSFQKKLEGNIEFRVQIGAFKDSIPDWLAKIYLQIEGIREIKDENFTSLQVGPFQYYEEAELNKNKLIVSGIPGAFVMAFNDGKAVSVKEAQMALEERDKKKSVKEKHEKE